MKKEFSVDNKEKLFSLSWFLDGFWQQGHYRIF